MKRLHRRVHGIAWLLLLPALVFLVYAADQARLEVPVDSSIVSPSKKGLLP